MCPWVTSKARSLIRAGKPSGSRVYVGSSTAEADINCASENCGICETHSYDLAASAAAKVPLKGRNWPDTPTSISDRDVGMVPAGMFPQFLGGLESDGVRVRYAGVHLVSGEQGSVEPVPGQVIERIRCVR